MNPSESQRVMNDYLKRIASTLAAVDHPRKAEVLADIQTHLEEKLAALGSGADIQQIIEEMGPPEEYAEGLMTDAAVRSPRLRNRGKLLPMFAGIVLALIATLGWPYFKVVFGKSYQPSSPFFDLKRLKQLRPGMSADKIRDELGYPWLRTSFIGRENEIVWFYTECPYDDIPTYKKCMVITDARDWKFIRADVWKMMKPERGHLEGRPPRYNDVGTLKLKRFDGRDLQIKPDDPNLYMIQVIDQADASNGILLGEWLLRHREYVVATWKNLPLEMTRRIKIVQAIRTLGAAIDKPKLDDLKRTGLDMATVVTMNEALWISAGRVLVYKAGRLYEYPDVWGSGLDAIEQSYRDDRLWLIRKLLSN